MVGTEMSSGVPSAANAPRPIGLPTPVGPSKPTAAWQAVAEPHEPLLPETTSYRSSPSPRCEYSVAAGNGTPSAPPASANSAATIGEATDVPPNTVHPVGWPVPSGVLSYTSTPVFGLPTAATSATERSLPQPVLAKSATALCHTGAAKITLQPLPPASHTVLLHTALFSVRLVPPTPTTSGESAGKLAAAGSSRQSLLR